MKNDFLEIGDVIEATPGWVFAEGQSDPDGPYHVGDNFNERHVVTDENNKVLPEYDRYDPTRIGARYVVEEVSFTGGGSAMFNEHYPNGHNIIARRLNPDGTYDPDGERVTFYQSGFFTHMSHPPLVGKMRRTFV